MRSTATRQTPAPTGSGGKPSRTRQRLLWVIGIAAAVTGLVVLYGIFSNSAAPRTDADPGQPSAGAIGFDVGEPGPGGEAPGFTLADGTGGEVSLSDYRGQSVLLYFQEGLTCQACWQQLVDLEAEPDRLRAAGIDAILSISTDPADLLGRAATDLGLTTPVLSDPDLAASAQYSANQYGMMGTSRNGHTFILVGPDGAIEWRADYGGAPDYTMYVPVDTLLADLETAS